MRSTSGRAPSPASAMSTRSATCSARPRPASTTSSDAARYAASRSSHSRRSAAQGVATGEQRPGRVAPDPGGERLRLRRQPDDGGGVAEQLPVPLRQHRAPTGGEHDRLVRLRGARQQVRLATPEGGLALLREDLPDGAARPGLQLGVEIDEAPAGTGRPPAGPPWTCPSPSSPRAPRAGRSRPQITGSAVRPPGAARRRCGPGAAPDELRAAPPSGGDGA